ncbi:SulP family inorganic anion transporter [Subtercola lobariae]|uniref:Sulfate permease n=1 Tax=Subtercola lobariae TaxID=1588641 RepID=A0A917AZL0_9MICO|nr:SulP family inorganic anion transporter [Subtercola lobariae]GGF12158.1 sulfate permease [Subtercola lobariae]
MRVLPGLTLRNTGREALAGVTLLAIAVPLNIGYAQIAGLPATAGLYALIVPAIVYALLVSSRQLVASPDAAAAALVASSLGGLAVAGSQSYLTMAFAQAIIAGVLFALCSIFKLGFLANFLSKPILIGFVGGLALDILVSQVAKMLGVSINSGGEFVEKLGDLITGLSTTNGWAVLISVASIAVLVVGRRVARAVPWALIVLIVSTIVTVLAGLEDAGVKVLGKVDAGPPSFTWPILDWITWLQLVPSAIALVLVTMAEGLLVARSYGEKHGYPTSPNRDLLAFGAANVAAGVSGGFTVGSSTSRTAAMDQAGSRTQLPSIVTAVGTLLLVIFGTALLEHIPSPAIGAIVAVAIIPLLGIAEFRVLWRQQKFEFIIGAVCFLGALLLGPIAGIVIAFVLSLINLARRAANPAIDVLSANEGTGTSVLDTSAARAARSSGAGGAAGGGAGGGAMTAPGLVVLRFAAPLFFANASVFESAVHKAVSAPGGGAASGAVGSGTNDGTKTGTNGRTSGGTNGGAGIASTAPAAAPVEHLVLDLEAVTDLDVTGAESFTNTRAWLVTQNVTLAYSRLRPDLEAKLDHYGLLEGVTVYPTNRAAIADLATAGPAAPAGVSAEN